MVYDIFVPMEFALNRSGRIMQFDFCNFECSEIQHIYLPFFGHLLQHSVLKLCLKADQVGKIIN